MSAKRIVLTGISGIRKKRILESFRRIILEEKLGQENASALDEIEIQNRVPILFPEKLLDIAAFLKAPLGEQRGHLRESYDAAVQDYRKLKGRKNAIAILMPLHATFMYYDRIFSSLSWLSDERSAPKSLLLSMLGMFRPDYFVNLIDDCYYMQQRIKDGPNKISIELREFIKWREIETVVTDHLANQLVPMSNRAEKVAIHPFERSPLFAVRHSQQSLFRYLFKPEVVRIYTSFLISEIRRPQTTPERASAMADQVNRLLETLSDQFCVFNPLTIDEKPLGFALKDSIQSDNFAFPVSYRWRKFPAPQLTDDPVKDVSAVSVTEVLEITHDHDQEKRSIVDRQVEYRDFRLIDQSDCVFIYRPTNRLDTSVRNWGGGCFKEFEHAKEAFQRRLKLQIYILVDTTDAKLTEAVGIEIGSSGFASNNPRVHVFKRENLDDPAVQIAAIKHIADIIQKDASKLTSDRTAAVDAGLPHN